MSLDSSTNIIDLKDLTFSYSGQDVLNLPSWSVAMGEHVLLIGSSGSGKSTLLNVLSGILSPTSGQVHVAGHALEAFSNRQRDRFRATEIGYVAQSFNLIPYLSAVDNIKLSHYFARSSKDVSSNNSSSESEIEALLSELNIDKQQSAKPISNLSIGQQQRVAIARAIVNKPKLLIADEPTSSLDESNRDTFMSILMETAKTHQMTMVFVSHDLSLGNYFHRVDSMSDINTLEV